MIPIMMMSEMPLPMPFSVMRSPSHITKTVPAVSEMTAEAKKSQSGITIAWPLVAFRLIAYPMDCKPVIAMVA